MTTNILKEIKVNYKISLVRRLESNNSEQFSEKEEKIRNKVSRVLCMSRLRCRTILSRVYQCNSRPCAPNNSGVVEVLVLDQ